MTRVDLHPEDLFDHLRHGELRDDERERLNRHCSQCSACAFELSLIEGSAYEAHPSEADHALGARATERMWLSEDTTAATIHATHADTDAVIDEGVVPSVRRARSHAGFRAAALLLAGVLVGGSVSAAALTGGSPFVLVELVTGWVTPGPAGPFTTSVPSTATRIKRRSKVAPRAELAREAAPPSTTSDTSTSNNAVVVAAASPEVVTNLGLPTHDVVAEVGDQPEAPVARTRLVAARNVAEPSARGVAGGPAPMPPVAQMTPADPASWLFRAASRARSAGRYQEAAALYGVLQRDYAGSETEVVARVALGRLWLTHLNDPSAALGAFESYLDAHANGPLSEEARSGRVVALRRLGRASDAEQALQDLLTHHPTTLYAKTVTGAP